MVGQNVCINGEYYSITCFEDLYLALDSDLFNVIKEIVKMERLDYYEQGYKDGYEDGLRDRDLSV